MLLATNLPQFMNVSTSNGMSEYTIQVAILDPVFDDEDRSTDGGCRNTIKSELFRIDIIAVCMKNFSYYYLMLCGVCILICFSY